MLLSFDSIRSRLAIRTRLFNIGSTGFAGLEIVLLTGSSKAKEQLSWDYLNSLRYTKGSNAQLYLGHNPSRQHNHALNTAFFR
jgi:hypothetical protein